MEKEKINQIRELLKTKKVSEVAKILNTHRATIYYYLSEENRLRKLEQVKKYKSKLTNEQKKEIRDRYKEYRRNYFQNKYQNDKEFREKIQKRNLKYYHTHKVLKKK